MKDEQINTDFEDIGNFSFKDQLTDLPNDTLPKSDYTQGETRITENFGDIGDFRFEDQVKDLPKSTRPPTDYAKKETPTFIDVSGIQKNYIDIEKLQEENALLRDKSEKQGIELKMYETNMGKNAAKVTEIGTEVDTVSQILSQETDENYQAITKLKQDVSNIYSKLKEAPQDSPEYITLVNELNTELKEFATMLPTFINTFVRKEDIESLNLLQSKFDDTKKLIISNLERYGRNNIKIKELETVANEFYIGMSTNYDLIKYIQDEFRMTMIAVGDEFFARDEKISQIHTDREEDLKNLTNQDERINALENPKGVGMKPDLYAKLNAIGTDAENFNGEWK